MMTTRNIELEQELDEMRTESQSLSDTIFGNHQDFLHEQKHLKEKLMYVKLIITTILHCKLAIRLKCHFIFECLTKFNLSNQHA